MTQANDISIKSFIKLEGKTSREIIDALAVKYGWSRSESNFSRKINEGSIRFRDLLDIADVLGYDVEFVKREEGGVASDR